MHFHIHKYVRGHTSLSEIFAEILTEFYTQHWIHCSLKKVKYSYVLRNEFAFLVERICLPCIHTYSTRKADSFLKISLHTYTYIRVRNLQETEHTKMWGMRLAGDTLQPTATHCNTLQHTATHCSTLQHSDRNLRGMQSASDTLQPDETHCNTLYHTATHRKILQHRAMEERTDKRLASDTLQTGRHSGTNCTTLWYTATHWNTPHHAAWHRNTLQDTARHCNTL